MHLFSGYETLVLPRDPRWFEDQLEFRPYRWTTVFRQQMPRFAYYPFGGGPRLCIGEGFAWMEALLLSATLVQRWAMCHDPSHRIELSPLVPLRLKGYIPMLRTSTLSM